MQDPIEFVKRIQNGLLIKICRNIKQHKAISNISEIGGIPVKVKERSKTVGVITGVHPDITEEEITEALKIYKCANTKRITRKIKKNHPETKSSSSTETPNPTDMPTKTVILSFESKTIPKQIILFSISISISIRKCEVILLKLPVVSLSGASFEKEP